MKELIRRFYKKAEIDKNRIIIPIEAIRMFGKEYYLDLYEDKMILIPIKKEK